MKLKVKGRDPCFKCSICGKFVKYDRRTTKIKYETRSVFDRALEQWFPEDETIFTHKKCEKKK